MKESFESFPRHEPEEIQQSENARENRPEEYEQLIAEISHVLQRLEEDPDPRLQKKLEDHQVQLMEMENKLHL